jgi:TusA-related sulfurtransferase
VSSRVAVIAIDCGDLPLGGGLLALVRPALDIVEPGGVIAILSSARSVREDLPSWCRAERHEYVGIEKGDGGVDSHFLARGSFSTPPATAKIDPILAPKDGRLTASDLLAAAPMPPVADPKSGFAPRGSRLEPGRPAYPFTLNDRDHAAPPEVAQLYDQAVGAQWDATRDIPWAKVKRLPGPVDAALAQIMTFLAENELSALYVPSRFIARIHPDYVETAMFLASQLSDEARHIDVFLKRARLCRSGMGVSATATSRSLLSLLQLEDFTEAAFLLSVLGEGTFLDLLTFVERYAPDEATAELVRRAKNDESRHVHFGLAHVRHGLARDPALYGRLEDAVRRRAASLHDVGGVPAPVQDALTILAAGAADPASVARGHQGFQDLLVTMHESRIKRLQHAGFTPDQADTISRLHTPNFM